MAPTATWTAPHDFAVLETLTAATMDTYLSSNDLFLYTMHGARVFNNAAISLTSGAVTALTFNSEHYDLDTAWTPSEWHSVASNTGRLTVPAAAPNSYFFIFGCVQFAFHATGDRLLRIRKNGATSIGEVSCRSGSTISPALVVGVVDVLVAGDYVELLAYQDSGGALNVNFQDRTSPEFGLIWLKAT